MGIPYVGFGNETLKKQPKVYANSKIACSKCGETHCLRGDDNGGELLLFYECSGKMYLAAVGHRLVAGLKPDVSGEIQGKEEE